MFSQLKLSQKLAFGFGAVIVLTAILGIIGWMGVSEMARTYQQSNAGNECLNAVNVTGQLRRDFAINGFDKIDGDLTAADKWQESYDLLVKEMQDTKKMQGLHREYREELSDALVQTEAYKSAFEKQEEGQRMKDRAFSAWGKTGWAMTDAVKHILDETINPARNAAEKSRNTEKLIYWNRVAHSLDQDVVQPFLLMRVTAVYLLATDRDEQWEGFRKQLGVVRDGLSRWRNSVTGNTELTTVAAKIGSLLNEYETAGNQYYEGLEIKRSADEEMASAASGIVALLADLQNGLNTDMQRITARTNTTSIVLTIVAAVVGVLLAYFITGGIVKPVRRIIEGLRSGSQEVTAASQQLSSASQQMSADANEQASSLEEVSSSLEEMSSMTKQNAGNAKQVDTLMKETRELVETGKISMGQLTSAIGEIKQTSDSTVKIIKTIDEIAMQTNLLALNAAVEAARAGDAGRGFAVVAEEVRGLAQRSAEAAKNTAQLIEGAQSNADNGVQLAESTGKAIAEIAQGSERVAALVAEISAASGEQAEGIDQINVAVAQMDKVTQQTAANSEESASAGEELSGQAESLDLIVQDLVEVVGASGNSESKSILARNHPANKSLNFHGSEGRRREDRAQLPRQNRGGVAVSEVKPSQVIPMDDTEGLEEF